MTGTVILDLALVISVVGGVVGLLSWVFASRTDRPARLAVSKVDRTLVRRK